LFGRLIPRWLLVRISIAEQGTLIAEVRTRLNSGLRFSFNNHQSMFINLRFNC